MKPKSIGLIGGAGPLAGSLLLERILSICMQSYGCYKDADFPQVFLISFPFSEMLTPPFDREKVQAELQECLAKLRQNGAELLAIACNTLHAFLSMDENLDDLIPLPATLTAAVQKLEQAPLVLCTSTSAKASLHQQFFACEYPDTLTQQEIDHVIDQILRGIDQKEILAKLCSVICSQQAHAIVLGCTELSLFSRQILAPSKSILDPLECLAQRIVDESFAFKKM